MSVRSARLLPALFVAAVIALLAACGGDEPAPEFVAFVGRLVDDDGAGIAGASVWVTSTNGGVLSTATTDADGRFVAGGLEKNIEVALVFSGSESHVRTVFRGETESRDMFLFTGAVFQRELAGQQEVVDEFTTAAGATSALMTFSYTTAASGAMVRGRVVQLVEDATGLYYVNLPGATVSIVDGAGTSYRVFYRGDFPNNTDPGPIEPSRTTTGEDARFVAFAVQPTGGGASFPFPVGQVTVTVTPPGGAPVTETSLVVEDGLTVFDLFTVP